ncbi:Multiple PDZ domain protein [Microtus ochrogaster]|uniref:Multiple PDZ domain protein n=1 Tax=Microtus ochrogaster TaxID=79684 RepID=A0A8J6L1S9_MICOH|nr:Multiple PDZ domain protein [Microtus ochrogaster]
MLLFGIDKTRALQAAERLQNKLKERGDVANEDKLSLLKSVLQSPLFSQILNLQTSLQQLKDQTDRKMRSEEMTRDRALASQLGGHEFESPEPSYNLDPVKCVFSLSMSEEVEGGDRRSLSSSGTSYPGTHKTGSKKVNIATLATPNADPAHIPQLSSAIIPTLPSESLLLSPNNGNLEGLSGPGAPPVMDGKPAFDDLDQLIKNMAQVRAFLLVT